MCVDPWGLPRGARAYASVAVHAGQGATVRLVRSNLLSAPLRLPPQSCSFLPPPPTRSKYKLPPMFGLPPGIDDCLVHFVCSYCASHQASGACSAE